MRILVLDDNPQRLDLFRQALCRNGNVVLCVETAPEAINELRLQDKFDFIFLDHDLGEFKHSGGYCDIPAGNGMQVVSYMVRELHESKRPDEVVVHSHNTDEATKMVLSLREYGFKVTRRAFARDMFK
jgi:CheY-like chemotaxis protein